MNTAANNTNSVKIGFEISSPCSTEDEDRAVDAIFAELAAAGIATQDQFNALVEAHSAAVDGREHDPALDGLFLQIEAAGNIALTLGWHDPDGAYLSLRLPA